MNALNALDSTPQEDERVRSVGKNNALTAYGALLRRLRRRAGLSQAGLAVRAGVCPNTIGNCELAIVVPRKDTHTLVRDALRPFVTETDMQALGSAYCAARSVAWRFVDLRRRREERA
jgi:transcriptional regulator with XRE-family HTH domain